MVAATVSEARVPVAPYQQIPGTDLTAMGTLGQGSLDNVVENCLYDGTVYTGMSASQVGTSNIVAVQPGYLVKGGPAYSLRDAFSVDVSAAINSVPDSSKTAIVCIVADGQEFPTTETRTFVDASKLPTDPTTPAPTVTQATPTRIVRSVVISSPAGAADVQPSPPAFSASLALIATVVVSNTGIVSVTQETGQQITRLDQIAPLVDTLVAEQSQLLGFITGLLSSVSTLAIGLARLSAKEAADFADLQAQLNALATRTTASPTATFKGSDYFTDYSVSNPAASGFACIISSGLKFASAGKADIPYAAYNPFSADLAQGTGALIVPAYTTPASAQVSNITVNAKGVPTNGYDTNFTQNAAPNATLKRRGFARSRIRAGVNLQATSVGQLAVSGDPSQIFAIDPTTFAYDAVNWGAWRTDTTELSHQAGYWQDLAARGFWTPVTGTDTTGNVAAKVQPFNPATSLMVDSVDLPVRTGGNTGTVRLLIVADANGVPDYSRTYADVTAPVPAGATSGTINFKMPCPILLKGGLKYHFAYFSNAGIANLLGTVSAQFPASLRFVNGGYAFGAFGSAASVGMAINAALFTSAITRVPLSPLQLAGGADLVDIEASLILPEGCSIGYEVQIGGQFVPLQPANGAASPLAGNPSNLPVNLVLTGTSTVAPIVDTSASTSRMSKSGVSLDHVSSVQTPPAPITTVHKSVIVDGWNSAVQTLTANLRTGTGYGTITAGTQLPDAIQPDGSLLRQWTWTLGTAVPSFEMEMIGTTSDTTKTFTGRQTNFDASP